MPDMIRFKDRKTPLLERFGIYYLNLFGQRDLGHHVFDFSDTQLVRTVRRISFWGILFSALAGLICVWPTVYIGVVEAGEPWYIQYTWIGAVNLVSILVELYLLFLIALRCVHAVSELINIHSHKKDFLQNGPFSITNILARTALEIQDPELHILGIDPFKRVSKLNLLLLGLLYKCKIFLTNLVAKWLLLYMVGPTFHGISINYIALPVECFWNAVVILRVVKEARLRLFGFSLANHVADHILHDGVVDQLSEETRIASLRAIGNAVVLARDYHPNMIVLLLRFQSILHMNQEHRYDDWNLFLSSLRAAGKEDRFFLLNLFTIAVAFDGRITHVEAENMGVAYGEYYALYRPRLIALTQCLHEGRLNAAAALCKIDFTPG